MPRIETPTPILRKLFRVRKNGESCAKTTMIAA
jgi:hypothetical protein